MASDGGLARYVPATQEFSSHGSELPDRRVHALAEDGKGGLWVATAAGLWRMDAGSGNCTRWPQSVPMPTHCVGGSRQSGSIATVRCGSGPRAPDCCE